mgnify:CR=1 FL=1
MDLYLLKLPKIVHHDADMAKARFVSVWTTKKAEIIQQLENQILQDLPETAESLNDLSLIESIQSFEKTLASYLPGAPDSNPLSELVQNYRQLYLNKRRKKTLDSITSMLVHSNYDTTPPPPLHDNLSRVLEPIAQIHAHTSKIVEQLHQLHQDLFHLDFQSPEQHAFCRETIHMALDLLVALFAHPPKSIQLAAYLYNDCTFLSHYMLELAL